MLLSNIVRFISSIIILVSRVVIGPLGALIHMMAVVIAFNESGFLAAALTFFLPVVSTVYWVIAMFGVYNIFVYLVFGFVGLLILFAISTFLLDWANNH